MPDIEFEEFIKTVAQSAALKGDPIRREEIDQAGRSEFARFLLQYDWVAGLWPDASKPYGYGGMLILDKQKQEGMVRSNSIPFADEQTARFAKQLCDEALG